mgnify:CR=1 FL=1
MTVTVETARLAAALTALNRVIERRNTIPVLGHVLFDGAGCVSATDLDMTLSLTIGADGHVPFLADLATLRKTLKGADKGSLTALTRQIDEAQRHLPHPGERVRTECDGLTTVADSFPVEDYPRLTAPEGQCDSWRFEARELADVLSYAAPCVSTEETRYYLNGVCFKACGDVLDVVATDGYKLARYRTGLPATELEQVAERGVILPRKAQKIASAMLAKCDGSVSVTIWEERIRIEAEGWTLETKVIDGTFPDYTRAIPAPTSNGVTVERDALLNAVGRVSSTSDERYNAVKLETEGGALTIQSNSSGGNSAGMSLSCDVTGDGILAGFNAAYLQDIIKAAPGDTITLSQDNNGDPARITCPADDRLTFVIMPVRF